MTEKEELGYEMREDDDLSTPRPSPYAARGRANMKFVQLDPDSYETFPTSESVNPALRLVLRAVELTAKAHAKAS